MIKNSTLTILFIFCVIGIGFYGGVVVADHKYTSANSGPIYDWIHKNNFQEEYNLDRPAAVYFSGGFENLSVAIVRTSNRLVESDNQYNSYDDLPEDLRKQLGDKNSVRQAQECVENERQGESDRTDNDGVKCDEGAKDTAFYKYAKLMNSESSGQVKDYSFADPTVQNQGVLTDVGTWNKKNLSNGWFHVLNNAGSQDQTPLPEEDHYQYVTETESREDYYEDPAKRDKTSLQLSNSYDTWTAAEGMRLAIYSNDPSVWMHINRKRNIPNQMTGIVVSETEDLYDNSYHQIGDSGTLRVVYDNGDIKSSNVPDDWHGVPTNISDGDTKWTYTNGDLTTKQFQVYIKPLTNYDSHSTSNFPDTCSPRCNITSAVDISMNKSNNGDGGVVNLKWDLKEYEEQTGRDLSYLGGNKVKFIVEGTVKLSYDKRIEEADRYCAKEDKNEKCTKWDVDWELKNINDEFISNSITISDSKKYYFTNGFGYFQTDSPPKAYKVKAPDGSYRYYVDISGANNAMEEPVGWNKITVGNGTVIHSQWKYFGSRDRSWDDVLTENGEKFASRAKPLRLHAYPAYRYYNQRKSTAKIHDPTSRYGNLENPSQIYPTPALVGHSTCIQSYPATFSQMNDKIQGSSNKQNNSEGSYEYHEPCYWSFQTAGQDPVDIPMQYYRLPHRVNNPEAIGDIPGENTSKLTYQEYLFHKKLSNLLSSNEERDAMDKLYTGSYQYTDTVIFKSQQNVDTIKVHGLVPGTSSKTIEVVGDTDDEGTGIQKIAPARVTTNVLAKCGPSTKDSDGFKCENSDHTKYKVEIKVERLNNSGQWVPVNTSKRGTSIESSTDKPKYGYVLVNNFLSIESESMAYTESSSGCGEEGYVNTDESGTVTVIVCSPPDLTSANVKAQFIPRHWSSALYTTSTFGEQPPTLMSQTDRMSNVTVQNQGSDAWMFKIAGVIIVITFAMRVMSMMLPGSKDYNPIRDIIVDVGMDNWVKVSLMMGAIFIIWFQMDKLAGLIMLIVALFLIRSRW